MKRLWLVAFCLAYIWLWAGGMSAQNAVAGGSISGQVADPSGAVVSGASVVLINVATGMQLTAKTNRTGLYSFPSLPVGAYKLAISQAGFKSATVQGVVVQVGQNTAVNVTLAVGMASESVTITAEAPLLRTTESTVSTVVNQNLIANLPLSGRRYTDFVLLTPNANADGDFGLVSHGRTAGWR